MHKFMSFSNSVASFLSSFLSAVCPNMSKTVPLKTLPLASSFIIGNTHDPNSCLIRLPDLSFLDIKGGAK